MIIYILRELNFIKKNVTVLINNYINIDRLKMSDLILLLIVIIAVCIS